MSDICVLTTFFNPLNSTYRIKNFYKFLNNIKNNINLDHLYVLEILTNDQTSKIKDCNSIALKNNSIIWQKESGLNYLLNNIDLSNYSKIIIIDCDVYYNDIDWINKTSGLLEKYHACQSFKKIQYENFNSSSIDSIVDGIVYNYITAGGDLESGNGGLVIGYNKDYIKHMNGFFDKAITGGGDTLNILPFLYDINLNLKIFENIMTDIRVEYFEYLLKARDYIDKNVQKKPCFFLDAIVNHMFHGDLRNRQYSLRYKYVKDHKYEENLDRDENNLFIYKKDNSELEKFIKNYFKNRQEIKDDGQPLIWCNTKYNVETFGEQEFVWLSDHNEFLLENISEIIMHLSKPEEIKDCGILLDDSFEKIKFNSYNKSQIKINGHKKFEIFADYFIPNAIGKNPDTRRLSIMLERIQFVDKNGDLLDYPLTSLL